MRWSDTALGRHASWLCAHTAFEASARLKELLLYLVRRSIETPDARISQVEIAVAVMGYDASFDPGTDAHVRIEIGRLRKAIELFYARCPDLGTARIDLPKGSYRPVLRRVPQPATILGSVPDRQTPEQPGPIVALADFRSSDPFAGEIAFLIGEEAQLRCLQAPLVRSGAMAVTRLPAGGEGDCLEAARRQGASLLMCGSIHHQEGRLRAYLTLIDVQAERALARESRDCRHAPAGGLRFADAVAEQIATELADPMLGAAPRRLTAGGGRRSLDILMQAFGFMATQDIQRVGTAIEGLRWLDGDDKLLATSGALLADLRRVATNSGLTPHATSPGECVELAEAALARDAGNSTARLALGYALLNDGRPERTAALAAGFPTTPGTTSVIADRRLLEVVAAANAPADASHATAGHNARAAASSPFFMDELATAIGLLASDDYVAAIAQLEGSANQDIYWLHLFKVAAFTGMGELSRARRARERLCALLPDAAGMLRATVTGFFPSDAIRAPLLDSLGRAGLRLH
jgi:hypothetical protein